MRGSVTKVKSHRRAFQFSLRSMLGLMVGCSIALSWMAHKRAVYRRQHSAVSRLKQLCDEADQPSGSVVVLVETKPASPHWLACFVGKECFYDIDTLWIAYGTLPEEAFACIREMPTIQQIGLGSNRIVDERLLPVLSSTPQVKGFLICGSVIKDPAFAGLARLPHLQALDLEGSTFTVSGLAHLRRFPKLDYLNLDCTNVDEDGLAMVSQLTRLRTLKLRYAGVSDEALARLKSLRNLEVLDLTGNPISDDGLASLEGLENLKSLNLAESRVSDDGLVHLRKMTSLRELILDNTCVTSSGADALRQDLPKLRGTLLDQ